MSFDGEVKKEPSNGIIEVPIDGTSESISLENIPFTEIDPDIHQLYAPLTFKIPGIGIVDGEILLGGVRGSQLGTSCISPLPLADRLYTPGFADLNIESRRAVVAELRNNNPSLDEQRMEQIPALWVNIPWLNLDRAGHLDNRTMLPLKERTILGAMQTIVSFDKRTQYVLYPAPNSLDGCPGQCLMTSAMPVELGRAATITGYERPFYHDLYRPGYVLLVPYDGKGVSLKFRFDHRQLKNLLALVEPGDSGTEETE